jgi:hypothetical protein
VSDLIYDKLRVWVFRFAARGAIKTGIRLFEQHVQPRLMRINGWDPAGWHGTTAIDAEKLPIDRPARVLLLVHGTFSSTVGSFGSLGATPWGKALIETALSRYDAVVGYDHKTLTHTPEQNARALYETLAKLPWATNRRKLTWWRTAVGDWSSEACWSR